MEAGHVLEPVYTSVPLKESPSQQFSVIEDCDLQTRTKYLNYTGQPLVMGYRNGVSMSLPARAHRHNASFIIRQEMEISNNLKHEVRNRLIANEGIQSQDFINFKELFLEGYRTQHHSVILKFQQEVYRSDISNAGGSIYLVESDIILSTSQDNIPLHPLSLEALSRPMRREGTSESGVSVTIVDNQGQIGPRYVRLLGKVIACKPIKDPFRLDGVYVSYQGLVEKSHENAKNYIERIEPSAIQGINWIFRTYAEACTAPEGEAMITHEIKELDLKGKKIGAEASVDKSEHEKERLGLERENFRLKQEMEESEHRRKQFENELERRYQREDHLSKMEALRQKDYYEDRSYSRKDSSEWLKAVPTLVVGLGAALVAFRSLF